MHPRVFPSGLWQLMIYCFFDLILSTFKGALMAKFDYREFSYTFRANNQLKYFFLNIELNPIRIYFNILILNCLI